jgi:hypothetical protein
MMKNKETNKWRNLILIVVVIAVVALAVIYGPGMISTVNGEESGLSSEEDNSVIVITNLFIQADMNTAVFRTNDFIYPGESSEVMIRYSPESLTELSDALIEVKSLASDKFSTETLSRMNDQIDVYVSQIKYNISLYRFLQNYQGAMSNFSSIVEVDDVNMYCDNFLEKNIDLLTELSSVNDNLIDFSNKNYNFYYNYEPNTLLVEFDVESEFEQIEAIGSLIDYEIFVVCGDEK